MSRVSEIFWPTVKDPPADAEALSHKLMVRAGLIRQLGAGLWSYLPAGWRVHRKVEAIIRSEMDAIGGQEMLMPVLQPAELWKETGRYGLDIQFRLEDRKGSEMVLAMTHEECLTFHVAREVRSYRDLPLILYHLQVKERDEPRPRAGVLRSREFVMKDSYSFDRDAETFERSYEKHIGAYDRIFDRCGLDWYRVESDVGMMGGSGAHEYMAPCPAGEDSIALAPGYAANVEVASARAREVELPPPLEAPEPVATPGLKTVEEVAASLGLPEGALVKSLPVVVDDERGFVLVLVRGDHRLNEVKLRNALGADFRPAREEEISERLGPAGFIGPVGAEVTVIKDAAIDGSSYVTGANRAGRRTCAGCSPAATSSSTRWTSAPSRAATSPKPARRSRSSRRSRSGTSSSSAPATRSRSGRLTSTRTAASTRSSWAATGSARPGSSPPRSSSEPTRRGSSGRARSRPGRSTWSPWRKPASPSASPLTASTRNCGMPGVEVLYDDRDAGPGEKLTDAELLGCPLRLVVGRRGLADGIVEAQERASGAEHRLPVAEAAAKAAEILESIE